MLRSVPLFADLEKKELESIADTMRQRTFPAGETVTREGSSGVGFFIVESGTAEVTVDGQPRGTIGPGDHFGEIALLTGSERTATIVAQSELHCYGMTTWDFKPLVETNPTIAWKLLQSMASKLNS
jgi:CRP-like cAMP-binding protein